VKHNNDLVLFLSVCSRYKFGNVCTASLLFIGLKNPKTYGKNVLDKKQEYPSSL